MAPPDGATHPPNPESNSWAALDSRSSLSPSGRSPSTRVQASCCERRTRTAPNPRTPSQSQRQPQPAGIEARERRAPRRRRSRSMVAVGPAVTQPAAGKRNSAAGPIHGRPGPSRRLEIPAAPRGRPSRRRTTSQVPPKADSCRRTTARHGRPRTWRNNTPGRHQKVVPNRHRASFPPNFGPKPRPSRRYGGLKRGVRTSAQFIASRIACWRWVVRRRVGSAATAVARAGPAAWTIETWCSPRVTSVYIRARV